MLEEAARYEWFADHYGWSSRQVDAEPDWLIRRYPVIAELKARNAEMERKEAQRKADAQARG